MTMPPSPPLLELRGLTKHFGSRVVLDGVDLTIERGETVVLLGGSGSGKTTLARLVAGLDQPTSGQVFLDGQALIDVPEHEGMVRRRRLAMVFQRAGLLDSLTVYENLAFPLRERGVEPGDALDSRIRDALRALDVEDAADKLPAELSGGMAKRVGIARAIVVHPEVLVFDEPTSGLDPVTSRAVDGLIERMRERYAVTSLVITHDMISAVMIADRIVLLAAGKLTAETTPDALRRGECPVIAEFAASSGIQLDELPRHARLAPVEIRRRWEQRRAREGPHEQASWLARVLLRGAR